jgi:predicted RNA-binding Zn-ribbon protein involved in translation (DUF1610 family)
MATPARHPRDTQQIHPFDAAGDEIRPTDIVFNCPHCGHGLCIDCRGAGLLTNCTECSKEVLVPIPEGMNVGDLDLTRDQTLGQLFYTRRALARAEQRIAELEEVIGSLKERRSVMEKARMTTLHHCAEIASHCQTLQRNQAEMSALLNRMLEIVASEQQH